MRSTRTKRLACEPLLSLSTSKPQKNRKVSENVMSVETCLSTSETHKAQHVCSPRCSALNSECPVRESDIDSEAQSDTEDILNTSDQNANDLGDISSEIEYLDGDTVMEFEELDMVEDVETVGDKPEKKKMVNNVGYVLVERFENKSELDKFWAENTFSKLYRVPLKKLGLVKLNFFSLYSMLQTNSRKAFIFKINY